MEVSTKSREDADVKKPLALLLAALIALAPACAMARVAYKTYQNEANGYAIAYPADWTVLSKETIGSGVDSLMKDGGANASAVEAYEEQIESLDMAVIMSGDGAVNAAIGYNPVSVKLTSGDLINVVYPEVLRQIEGAFEDCAPLAGPEAVKAGKLEFVKAAYKIRMQAEDCVMLQALYSSDSTFYTINCTVSSDLHTNMDALEAMFDAMLASFVPV
jgi:hypothetical protein